MTFLKKIFGWKSERLPIIRVNSNNLKTFPKIEELFNAGKVKFDSKGRLRYLHGAPVGDMIFQRTNSNNDPIYKESTEEWFDPDSQKAENFIWE